MDEHVDILNADGTPSGRTSLKSEAHKLGLYHPTIHVWFYRADGQVLLQQRGRHKETHPLLWDVSVAGHISSGEGVLQAAVREIKEEIGLDIDESDLQKFGEFSSCHKHREDFTDHELHHSFTCLLEKPLSSLRKQESEVETLALIPLLQLAEETWGLARTHKYVPHGSKYYQAVIKAIKKELKGG